MNSKYDWRDAILVKYPDLNTETLAAVVDTIGASITTYNYFYVNREIVWEKVEKLIQIYS